ncbi:uncharacterized protein LOC111064579 [Nilaparvata lugens]|uniref:uncharacterized protein LOC111064579 n=1 Tax=Nilaparvata lugens TaxID=108931 RepID=UPI00193E9CB1|nr:uncharacterized protein LOC111064579 [Nilaparvata lugens]
MTKTTVIGGCDHPTTANGVARSQQATPTGVKRVHGHRRKRSRSDRSKVMRFAKQTGLKKMLAVMSEELSSGGGAGGGGGSPGAVGGEGQCRDVTQDFLTTGRVGRRNALPNILGEHARLSTAQLPDQMSCLSVKDDGSKSQQSTSSQNSHTAGGSSQPKS